jgi:tetratricopeptide (TPR) repeat protein
MTRVVAVLVLMATSAHADTAPSPLASPAPWAQGVTDEQKAQARVLLDAGNALLLDKKYVEALDKYAAAAAMWDHPAIRFNMVRCQIQLGRNLEAYENLELALKYGAAPLEETVYNEAVAYQKLLATQIGDIKVSCAQPGVKLTLDGQPLANCPAQESRRVLAGPHQVVGTKQGLMTRTLELVVVGGKDQGVDVKLDPLATGAKIVHRWPGYLPWTVFGGGLALTAIGAVTLGLAHNEIRAYDDAIDAMCTDRCTADELAPLQHYQDDSRRNNILGGTAVIIGATAVATGAVMVYLNRGRTIYPEVAPVPGGGATVSLGASW